ncbi:hypothetical protein AA23498_2860 [Acetobacter nitrogenifigens DSM 23921 = NBRC 105050]|uniref:Uncharacterized protein n=1 Tax=Acetobacter nitrogenifigens DSM 23921 = NBRC 105050 TaxID=1120919 RepID=A0A511XDN5_9PROT|nr:hypothetical protein [Acetobacter nitrogenifigens]GBQ97314.1 hypothetical protein AA23498_2860 [Acetobacter nitrogenifigens DSM 23921 = NBRC 105050]GEN61011.1 hypothetical protein ANI02nite_28950 [Acetobacter nitrogenifigens DSM 23921 = NBRC 105050]
MGYDVEITRNPLFSRKKGPQITLDEWFAIIRADKELKFFVGEHADKYGVDTAIWSAHPDPESESRYLWGAGGVITAKYPDNHLMAKMVRIARRLDADVVGDNGEIYELDNDGALIVLDDHGVSSSEFHAGFMGKNALIFGVGHNKGKDFLDRIYRDTSKMTGQHAYLEIETYKVNTMWWKVVYYAWYQGFITAINENRKADGFPIITYKGEGNFFDEDMIFFRNYFDKKPDASFFRAVNALIEFRKSKLGFYDEF